MIMKHAKHFLLMATMLLSSLSVIAHDFEVNGIYYNITSEEVKQAEVTFKGDSYNSYSNEYSGSITIPATVTYGGVAYSVTSIGEYAFRECTSLTAITLPESLTSIGDYAFRSCSSLTSITIPESVTRIGYASFYGCSSLTSITIPESVTSIENDAFDGTAWYDSLPDGLVYIGKMLYEYKGTMPANTSIEVKEGIVSISPYAFYNCSSLTAITIPESVTSIGKYAFYGTAWYNSLPDGLVYIGKVLYKYKGTMPENTSIEVKEGIVSISSQAFSGCTSLTAITLPEGVTSIGEYAFSGCTSLTAINIPEGVTSIGYYAFKGCSSLTAIVVAEGNKVYDSRGGCNAIIKTSTNTLLQGCSSTIIPEGVTSIGDYAFSSCSSLTAITLPEGVTSIGDYAFYACRSLTTITLPDGMTSIGDYAFELCTSLTAITLPESVTSIGDYAFWSCSSLTAINIPEGVTSIGKYAFNGCSSLTAINIPESVTSIGSAAFRNCISLTSITCKAVTPPTIGDSNTFFNVNKSIPVYVPAASVEAYKSAEYWSAFTNIQPLPNEYILTVSSAGYASLFLDYAAAIPEGVEAYIATSVEGTSLIMNRVEGVLPANTGVIVIAKEGTYTFVESEDTPADVEGNLLSGTATDTYITAQKGYAYYVLARKNGLVAMYHPTLTDGQFLNNANRAYLALDQSNFGIFDEEVDTGDDGIQLSNGLRFDFSGTTDIAPSTLNSHPSTLIYDLQGRRVENPTKGIYIINGKKVVWE
ncbi:MAG: leucine-rich repeat domain-containing protein [Bacteroidales bacterium]|nr:leucine-rich repeat domain-containing protein [Bacteroidales bacterium]